MAGQSSLTIYQIIFYVKRNFKVNFHFMHIFSRVRQENENKINTKITNINCNFSLNVQNKNNGNGSDNPIATDASAKFPTTKMFTFKFRSIV